jgi:hypothetical protein
MKLPNSQNTFIEEFREKYYNDVQFRFEGEYSH